VDRNKQRDGRPPPASSSTAHASTSRPADEQQTPPILRNAAASGSQRTDRGEGDTDKRSAHWRRDIGQYAPGSPGSGKSHIAAALGRTLVENGYRVLFTRTTDLVQRLQQARQALSLESAIEKLDKYHLLILEDLCYVRKDQAETSVLFELIAARYERRSLMVTANQPFGEWTSVFPEPSTSVCLCFGPGDL
jgi:hypothetical protein